LEGLIGRVDVASGRGRLRAPRCNRGCPREHRRHLDRFSVVL